MDYLYQKKREYEKLLNDLNNLYTKLEDCYSNLFLCRKKMEKCITIDDIMYLKSSFDDIIDKVYIYKKSINDYYIPNVKEIYNKILLQLNEM